MQWFVPMFCGKLIQEAIDIISPTPSKTLYSMYTHYFLSSNQIQNSGWFVPMFCSKLIQKAIDGRDDAVVSSLQPPVHTMLSTFAEIVSISCKILEEDSHLRININMSDLNHLQCIVENVISQEAICVYLSKNDMLKIRNGILSAFVSSLNENADGNLSPAVVYIQIPGTSPGKIKCRLRCDLM